MAETTPQPIDSEVIVLKPDEGAEAPPPKAEQAQTDKPTEKAPSKLIITATQYARKIEEFAKIPLVWLIAAILTAIGIFYILSQFTSTPEAITAPKKPLTASEAIMPARDDRELMENDVNITTLERLIAKAAALYARGDIAGALDLYEQVSLTSESLWLFYLGVARMRKIVMEIALGTFSAQIAIDEYKTPGAINAAVCALRLGLENEMRRYIKIAKDYLHLEISAPLYSYYYTLIGYYGDKPFSALASADAPSIGYMNEGRNMILAKMHLMFDDPSGAIEALEKVRDPNNAFTLGLLYARSGKYDVATDLLNSAIASNVEPSSARAALTLVYLKSGLFRHASNVIDEMVEKGEDPLIYPIKVKLKERLFDIALAQDYFTKTLLIDENVFLQTLFSYIPFKMIEPEKSISEITRGQLVLSESEMKEAEGILSGSRKLASSGAKMSAAVKLAVNNRLLLANLVLQEVEKEYKNSDVIEYNLALTYAQLGNFAKAHRHFHRAYFLNRAAIEAGVYALVLAPYANVKDGRLMEELSSLLGSGSDEKTRFYAVLLSFYEKNYQATVQWLERKEKSDNTMYVLLDLFSAEWLNQTYRLREAAGKLIALVPNDVLFEMLNLYAVNKTNGIRQFAFELQRFMTRDDLNFQSLYYGAPIVRDLYIKLALITGNLEQVSNRLSRQLFVEKNEVRPMMQTLVVLNIYRQRFEEAYSIANTLIDEFGMNDSVTLLYGAVASIGAGHKENAIALLQLAKLSDPMNREVRYALGLLYQEAMNAKGAALEYAAIGGEQYQSVFFDFNVRPFDDPEAPPLQTAVP
ncbi:MAG: hypothetical protein LBN32_04415 [Helicobacteraceae bacterium]|jgi:tetratricopeptide (TPR) repeat protein|nr:hypothetical protein [Helicobacteraceae bacterium]